MKTTRNTRILAAAAAAIGVLASCQQQEMDTPNAGQELVPVTLSASFNEVQTKVSYEEEDTGSNYLLKPVWEEGDKVYALDGEKIAYTFEVTEVNDGVATLTGNAPASCNLNLIYISGDTPTVSNGKISVSYDGQAGDKTMPAVMFSNGEIKYGTGQFNFSNPGAVIGISAVKGVPKDAVVSKITVSGENLSAATIELEGSSLKLTATTKSGDSITITPEKKLTVKDDNGTLSSIDPILIAVPAGAVVSKVSATTNKGTFDFTLTSPSTLSANQYSYVKNQKFTDPNDDGHDYVEIGGLKWATMNVGATTVAGDPSTCYGHYFFWGGTEGYEYDSTNSKWVKASPDHTTLDGGFCWKNTPYQTVNTTSNTSTKFTKYLGSTSSSYKDPLATDADALKTVLDQTDDAAHANWGGEWRMPKKEDFQALYVACGGTGSSKTPDALSSSNPGKGIYWVDEDQTFISEYEGVAGLLFCDDKGNELFFPAAGFGSDASLFNAGSYGRYWSSSLHSSDPYYAYLLRFSSDFVNPQYSNSRFLGQSVRPVSDL